MSKKTISQQISDLCNDETDIDYYDDLEDKVLNALRSLDPIKVQIFKMYYCLDEYKGQRFNYRLIEEKCGMKGRTANRWVGEILKEVKIKLKQNGYIK